MTKKHDCKVDGCELSHCRKCGCHYDLYCAEGRDECDGCQIEEVMDRTEAQVKAFGGDSEAAAKFFDW